MVTECVPICDRFPHHIVRKDAILCNVMSGEEVFHMERTLNTTAVNRKLDTRLGTRVYIRNIGAPIFLPSSSSFPRPCLKFYL